MRQCESLTLDIVRRHGMFAVPEHLRDKLRMRGVTRLHEHSEFGQAATDL